MTIEWGTFYFECEKTAAILIAATPVILFFQLPGVIRGVTGLIRYVGRTIKTSREKKIANSLAARVEKAEK